MWFDGVVSYDRSANTSFVVTLDTAGNIVYDFLTSTCKPSASCGFSYVYGPGSHDAIVVVDPNADTAAVGTHTLAAVAGGKSTCACECSQSFGSEDYEGPLCEDTILWPECECKSAWTLGGQTFGSCPEFASCEVVQKCANVTINPPNDVSRSNANDFARLALKDNIHMNGVRAKTHKKYIANQFIGKPRIVGGTPAEPEDFEFMVGLDAGGYLCGGSLISPTVVLTAAHCLYGLEAKQVTAYFGAKKSDFYAVDAGDIRKAESIHYPSDYDETTMQNDVGIIKLSAEVTNFAPVQLSGRDPYPSNTQYNGFRDATVIGFGTTSYEGAISEILLKGGVTLLNRDECKSSKYGYGSSIMDDMVCAAKDGVDACQGDSGGPLLQIDPNTAAITQVGIVSWGINCGDAAYPGVYSSIAAHINYIKRKMGDDGPVQDSLYGSCTPEACSPLEGECEHGSVSHRPDGQTCECNCAGLLYGGTLCNVELPCTLEVAGCENGGTPTGTLVRGNCGCNCDNTTNAAGNRFIGPKCGREYCEPRENNFRRGARLKSKSLGERTSLRTTNHNCGSKEQWNYFGEQVDLGVWTPVVLNSTNATVTGEPATTPPQPPDDNDYYDDECKDRDVSNTGLPLKDSEGYGCADYNKNPSWCELSANFDTEGFESRVLCCVCGGGTHPDEDTGDCMNAPSEYKDTAGDSCSSYTPVTHEWCNKYDVRDPKYSDLTDLVFISQMHCCECGGGSYDGGLTYSDTYTTSTVSTTSSSSQTTSLEPETESP